MKKSELIAFRTTPENHKYLQKLAKEDERSVSWILDKMVRYFSNKGDAKKTIRELNK